jgi:hypothetical protein
MEGNTSRETEQNTNQMTQTYGIPSIEHPFLLATEPKTHKQSNGMHSMPCRCSGYPCGHPRNARHGSQHRIFDNAFQDKLIGLLTPVPTARARGFLLVWMDGHDRVSSCFTMEACGLRSVIHRALSTLTCLFSPVIFILFFHCNF